LWGPAELSGVFDIPEFPAGHTYCFGTDDGKQISRIQVTIRVRISCRCSIDWHAYGQRPCDDRTSGGHTGSRTTDEGFQHYHSCRFDQRRRLGTVDADRSFSITDIPPGLSDTRRPY
jgi:hypothetical protein